MQKYAGKKELKHCTLLSMFDFCPSMQMRNHISENRPLHGFHRHLGYGALAAKITVNVWDIIQLSTLITPQLLSDFEKKDVF